MRTVQDIYTEYKIMPSLQLHQLRVAGVAKYLCEHMKEKVATEDVVLTCLFHDMGNIIKSDLKYFPDFCEPEGFEYWDAVKKEFLEKYGSDHHKAIVAIAEEIGLPKRSIELINGIGYSKIGAIVAGEDIEQKICEYADMRIGPHGVLPMEKRIEEGRERYKSRNIEFAPTTGVATSDEHYQNLLRSAGQLESQIFADTTIAPEDIIDAAIEENLAALRNYPVA